MNIEQLIHHWGVWCSTLKRTLHRNKDDQRFGQYLMNQMRLNGEAWPEDFPDVFNVEDPWKAYDTVFIYLTEKESI